MHNLPQQFMNYVTFKAITGETGKFPCNPQGIICDPHNPANWITHNQALAASTFDTNNPSAPFGVAFVLTENDPYFFLDLDKCLKTDGTWMPEAAAIYSSFAGAMGEVSVSGTGLHVIGKCNPEMLQDRKNKWAGWLEFYTHKRFIAFGTQGFNPIGGTSEPEIDWTQQLLRIVPQRETLGELPQGIDPNYTGPEDDNELILKMLASKGGAGAAFGGKATVAQLWNADPILCQIYPDFKGDTAAFDHSSADAALFAHLAFWTGKDMPRMERLFRQSKLMRPKFEKREDYRLKTIQGAARLCNRVYDFKKATTLESPQPLMREIPNGANYPVEALGPLRTTVEAVHDKTQAPVAIAAQSALAVASLAVQAFGNVETLGGSAPSSLFVLTIAESGERKSGCDRLLMKSVRDHEQDAQGKYNKTMNEYSISLKLWEKKKEKLINDAVVAKCQDIFDAANDSLKVHGMPPEPPFVPNRTATEPTFEGLIKLFMISHPALGLFTDEGGGFIGGHAMNNDNALKTCAGLSKLWDGESLNRTRAGDGTVSLYGRRLAVHIMAQPIAARPLLADPIASGQGFLARCLICEPRSTIGTRTRRGYNANSDSHIATFGARLRLILESSPPMKEGTNKELEPPVLSLSSGAKELMLQYYEDTEQGQLQGGKYETIRPYASKSAEQAARIACVLTLWENLQATMITPAIMANGIALAQFYLDEAKRLADAAVISVNIAMAETLRLWLLNNWNKPEILPREIIQYGPNALRESPKVKAALALLEQNNWVVRLPESELIRGAKRKEAYWIVRD